MRTLSGLLVVLALGRVVRAEDAPAVKREKPTSTEVAAGVGPFTKGSYPQALVERPLTLVRGMLQLTPTYAYQRVTRAVPPGAPFVESAGSVNLALAFGVIDRLQVDVASGLVVHETQSWSESVDLGAHFLVLDGRRLDLAPGITAGLDFADGFAVSEFQLDALTRFLIANNLFLLGGEGLLRLQLDPDVAWSLGINVGLGYQITYGLAVLLRLPIADIHLDPSGGSEFIFVDYLPASARVLLAISSRLDVFVDFDAHDILDIDEETTLQVGISLRI